jgi:uncharacterized cupredoxin-like copper-binding protein
VSEQRISTRARVLAIPAVGAMAIGVAVFGRNSSAQDATGTPGASPEASPAASPTAGLDLKVSAKDILFDPKTLEGIANKDVKITVTNEGAAVHNFNIDALNVKTKDLNPGESETVTVNGAAGDYEYYCSIPGHKEAGMVGTLTLKDEAASAPAPGGNTLEVTANDIYFDPKTLEAPANTDVTINITNKGAATHDFYIDALNVQSPMLNPGDTATVKVNGAAGDYEYYCSVPGHKEAGMVGTLTLK